MDHSTYTVSEKINSSWRVGRQRTDLDAGVLVCWVCVGVSRQQTSASRVSNARLMLDDALCKNWLLQ